MTNKGHVTVLPLQQTPILNIFLLKNIDLAVATLKAFYREFFVKLTFFWSLGRVFSRLLQVEAL